MAATTARPIPLYPVHRDDDNRKRHEAAFRRISRIIEELGASPSSSWAALMENLVVNDGQAEAAKFARAEIGLSWFPKKKHCEPLTDTASADEANDEAPKGFNILKFRARAAIRASIRNIEALGPGQQVAPVVRQAGLAFAEELARNKACLVTATSLAERLYRNHPDDPGTARLLAYLMEQNALLVTRDKKDETNEEFLSRARQLYERMVEVGDDRTDVFALGRLALIGVAFDSNFQTGDGDLTGPDPHTLEDLKRAWARFERENYPTDVRHYAERVLALWGSVLLTSYPQAIVAADKDSDRKDWRYSRGTTRFGKRLNSYGRPKFCSLVPRQIGLRTSGRSKTSVLAFPVSALSPGWPRTRRAMRQSSS